MQLFTLITIYLLQDRFLYVSSSHNVSKSMAFVFGGEQKHFDSTYLSRHSTDSSWVLQNSLNPSVVTKHFAQINFTFLTRDTYTPSTVH